MTEPRRDDPCDLRDAYEAGWLDEERCRLFEEHMLICRECGDDLADSLEVIDAIREGGKPGRRGLRLLLAAAAAVLVVAAAGAALWLDSAAGPPEPDHLERAQRLVDEGRDDEALPALRASLEEEPTRYALYQIGRILKDRGDLAGAVRHLRRALECPYVESHSGGTDDRCVYGLLCHSLIDTGALDEADALTREHLAGDERWMAWERANLHSRLAWGRLRRGEDRARADEHLRLARLANEVYKPQSDPILPESPYYNQVLFRIAVQYGRDGREALRLAERILDHKTRYGSKPDHRERDLKDRTSDGLKFVGLACLLRAEETGDPAWLDRAGTTLRRSLDLRREIVEESSRPSRYGVVWAAQGLALVRLEQRRPGEAVDLTELALAELEKCPAPGTELRADLLVNLATARLETGDALAARPLYQQALALADGIPGTAGREVSVMARLGLLRVLASPGDPRAVALEKRIRSALGEDLSPRVRALVEAALAPDASDLAALPRRLSLNSWF